VTREADDARRRARWSDPPGADPHRDVAGALHDVSNELTVLLGWVAEARAHGASADAVRRALDIVEERAHTARDVARRAIGAPGSIDDREAALDEVLERVVESLAVEAQRAGVTMRVAPERSGVRVPLAADASQVLTNVLLNALAWTPRGGTVAVEAACDDTKVTVAVQDGGPGIPADRAGGIFEGSSTREGGAGIGLRHARAVARAAGGELELVKEEVREGVKEGVKDGVREEGEGSGGGARGAGGARFRLKWPRVGATAPVSLSSIPRAATLKGTRVLVVEDDADVALLLETALGARGAHVVVATTAEEVMREAAKPLDAALVDLSPIAADVKGAVEALRRGSPAVAIVFISGSAVGLPVELDGVPGVKWVRKPFEVGEIVAALAETRRG
jgi:CheY-like chemotaxis protein